MTVRATIRPAWPLPADGGLDFPLDPSLSAWEAKPIWRPEVDPEAVLLGPAPHSLHGATDLEPDRLVPLMAKTSEHASLYVPDPATGDSLRIWLADGRIPHRGAFVLPHDEDFDVRLHSTRRVRLWLQRKSPGQPLRQQRVSPFHRHRYIRMLRIVDGLHVGASRREIASVLLGQDVRSISAAEWQNTSQRRHLARLIVEANAYVDGNYLAILRGNPPKGHLFRASGGKSR